MSKENKVPYARNDGTVLLVGRETQGANVSGSLERTRPKAASIRRSVKKCVGVVGMRGCGSYMCEVLIRGACALGTDYS